MMASLQYLAKLGAAIVVLLLLPAGNGSGTGRGSGSEGPSRDHAVVGEEPGFSVPIVHWRPPPQTQTDEKFVVPIGFNQAIYLAEVRIGERAQPQYLMIDTGSSLTWTQCYECPHCGVGEVPPYERSHSRTFQDASCDDERSCPKNPPGYGTSCLLGRCGFFAPYNASGQNQFARGYMAIDTFHFVDSRSHEYHAELNVVFGCAHQENVVATRDNDCTGFLGLGLGEASFLNQTGVTKFSYCTPAPPPLRHISRRSNYLRFGSHAQISGKTVPSVQRWGKYYIHLKGITYQYDVYTTSVPVLAHQDPRNYVDTMIDTGTALLTLPASIYDPLLGRIGQDIKLAKANTPSPGRSGPRHCYLGTMHDVEDMTVTLSFDGGVDIELYTSALFFELPGPRGATAVCVAVSRDDDSSEVILGMFAQRNVNVGYDLNKGEIAMDHTNCVLANS